MHKSLFIISILYLSSASNSVFANEMQNEIEHLLNYVENTQCKLERNGDLHSGKYGVKHIKRKYNYFKDKIDSAEKFIELSATKSTMSGKYYMIHCPGKKQQRTQGWLMRELDNYRKKNKP